MILLTALTARLASTPADFLAASTVVPAVLADAVFAVHTVVLAPADVKRVTHACADPRGRAAVSLAAWLVTEPSLAAALVPLTARATLDVVDALAELSTDVDPARWLSVAERREEAVRTALMTARLLPEGESEVEAGDRLLSVSSAARRAAVQGAAAAARRAKEIADALAAQAAKEAAAQYVPS